MTFPVLLSSNPSVQASSLKIAFFRLLGLSKILGAGSFNERHSQNPFVFGSGAVNSSSYGMSPTTRPPVKETS